MLATYYYFPITDGQVLMDTCGDSNDKLNEFRPLSVGYVGVDKRKLSYLTAAVENLEPFFSDENALNRARHSLTEIHQVFTEDNGIKMINLYFTFCAKEAVPNIYYESISISENCLSDWNTDENTKLVLTTELERMSENYGRLP